jgi:uncharacterized protein (TIGR03086 family)
MNHLDALRSSIALVDGLLDEGPIDEGPIESETSGSPTPCTEFDVAALADHLISTHEFLIAAAGGTPVESAGSHADRHRAVGASAIEAWTVRGTGGVVDLGGNDLPASFGLALHAFESFVHGWDLAAATGRAFDPAPDLVATAWEQALMIVSDGARSDQPGAPYGLAVEVHGLASELDRLIAFTGRDPRFSRS